MKRLTVSYFAIYREQTGLGEETVESTASTAAELFAEMQRRHPDLASHGAMKFARNDEIVPPETALESGDRVLFFPPVAGG